MRAVRMYQPSGCEPSIPKFFAALEPKLMDKVTRQIFYLAGTPPALWREPHIKHFSLKKYSQLYELREKNKILVRVIFTVCGGDIVLLEPFAKHQLRDTMKALERSLRMSIRFSEVIMSDQEGFTSQFFLEGTQMRRSCAQTYTCSMN